MPFCAEIHPSGTSPRYGYSVTPSMFLKGRTEVQGVPPLETPSLYWAELDRFQKKLRELARLKDGWDSYDAEAPSVLAVRGAAAWLHDLVVAGLTPSSLLPSVEGGIALGMERANQRATVEVYNDGEVVAIAFGGDQEPKAWAVANDAASKQEAIQKIRAHLSQKTT
jgi:hypothetical protein